VRTAILCVDVQRGLVEGPLAVAGADGLVGRLTGLLDRARAAGVSVVHIQDDGETPGSPNPRGTRGWRLALPVLASEPVVAKRRDDAFDGTVLDDLLRRSRVDTVVVVGIQSEMCVAATARGALVRGYRVVLPRDGHATYDIPADDRGGVHVPAAHVARAAEWSLGDQVRTPRSVDALLFSDES
jgi:streptothricin hydrolase